MTCRHCSGPAPAPQRRQGLCLACFGRWRRAGYPATGVPPRRTLPRTHPDHPTACGACGGALEATSWRLCAACRMFKRRHGRTRTPAERLAQAARRAQWGQPRACRDCGRTIPRNWQCQRCAKWRIRHGGHRFPERGAVRPRPPPLPAGWIRVAAVGRVPPAGYCTPGASYGQVPGCAQCAWRGDCAALSRTEVA